MNPMTLKSAADVYAARIDALLEDSPKTKTPGDEPRASYPNQILVTSPQQG
jgi:hypothetical protein